MKILFAFENPLPSAEADAEVFVTTARHLSALATKAWMHVPLPAPREAAKPVALAGIAAVRAWAPLRPAALRHLCCGLTIGLRREFREADFVYTRNLWIALASIVFGQRVVFDHYRPWPDQIPPLQYLIYRLLCSRRFLVNICHSNYTAGVYAALGVPAAKLVCVHNGYEPQRFETPLAVAEAKQQLGLDPAAKTVVYTGRINHKKGLDIALAAARLRPTIQFVLVGSYGEGPIERLAKTLPNVRVVPWQPAEAIARYIHAADVLLIPPSAKPLTQFGSTVLPLKLFLYMAAGRPIIAGQTADVRELLRDGENALLCPPDDPQALARSLDAVLDDAALGARLAATALAESRGYTWNARAARLAEVIAARLEAEPARGGWGPAQTRTWLRQSRRWLQHLVRHRSWVLPPEAAPQGAD